MISQRCEGAAEAVEDDLRTDADEQRDRVRAAGGRVLVARRAALARGAGAALHLARLRARPRGARAGAARARRALRRRARRPLPPPAARQVQHDLHIRGACSTRTTEIFKYPISHRPILSFE